MSQPSPVWLNDLRATDEWRRAHTPLDAAGNEVVPQFAWAESGAESFAAFVEHLRGFGERVAVVDYSQVRFRGDAMRGTPAQTTYVELADAVCRCANYLTAQNVGAWDPIALCLPNCLEVLTLMYGAWLLGAMVTPINPDQRVLGSGFWVLGLLFGDEGISVKSPEFITALAAQPAQLPPQNPEPKTQNPDFYDPVLILHTSGTTGPPKGAMLSPFGLLTGALALQEGFALSGEDRFLMVNPLFHINSIAFALALLGVGATIVIPPFGQHWEVVARERVTISSMVQRHLIPVLRPQGVSDQRNAELFWQVTGDSLKWIAVGSGPLSPDVQRELLDRGVLILFRWGMSENHLGGTNMRPGHPLDYYRERIGSTGPTNRFLNLFVMDDDGNIKRTGRGRLLQRGNIFVAYAKPEDNVGAFAGGFHDTGDIADITEEGHVTIIGRSKDIIIRSGENIHPQSVDDFLMRHPHVLFAQTVGVPHPEHSEEVGAFVVTDDNVSEQELRDYAQSLGVQRRPKKFILLPPEAEQTFLRFSGPGKPQRAANQVLFWKMLWLEEAVRLMTRDGVLPEGTMGRAVPDGSDVALIVVTPNPKSKIQNPKSKIADYLPRASGLSEEEFQRTLQQRGLTLDDLLPAHVRVRSTSSIEP